MKINLNKLSFLLLILSSAVCYGEGQVSQINLDDLTQKALKVSNELKIAHIDIKINQTDIKAARSHYYPSIQARFNTEYLKGLQNTYSPVAAVGNTIIPTGTRYQNSVGIMLQQNLIDFGSNRRKVMMAKNETEAKASVYGQRVRDLRIKLIELYTDALISYRSLKANESLFTLAKKAYQLKKRLYQAGTISNLDVADEAIQLAQALDNNQVYKDSLCQSLLSLSYYTQESYDPENIDITDLREEPSATIPNLLIDRTPESRMYDALISQKQNEIEYLKRQYLPQISLYSNYNLYGFNQDQWQRSIGNMAQRTISFGLSINMPIFDGFKNQAAIEKAKLERQKLQLQKSEKLAQVRHQANLYNAQVQGYGVQLQTKATILNKAQDKMTMVVRLSDLNIVDQSKAVKEHIERIKKQLEMEKSIIQALAAIKKLKILAEG